MSIDARCAMVIYEVNLQIDASIIDDYRTWLRAHVDAILAIDGFVDAQVFAVDDPPPPADRVALCVHYRVRDAAALQAYFREHAPRLRAEGVARFGDRFSAARRVLRPTV